MPARRPAACAAALALAAPAVCKDIKVLSFTGLGAGLADVNNQHMCFEKDLIPGVTIRGEKSKTINAETLKGYDVVLLPGGGPYALNQKAVDPDAVRAFVRAGGGFYGTCAGAMTGCAKIIDGAVKLDGIGVSRATCHSFSQVGTTQNQMTAAGARLFGLTGDVPIDHHNGPAMDANGSTVAAVFDDTRMKGKASIVLDTFGAGRSILISPHPEHPSYQNCGIVSWAAAYAGGLDGPAPPATSARRSDAAATAAAGLAAVVAAVNADPRSTWRAAAAGARAAARRPGTVLPFAPYAHGAASAPLHGAPASFDARTQWPACASIGAIRDQAECGSCWAFGSTEAFEDRYCIATGRNTPMSPQHLMACNPAAAGCFGGSLITAYGYITTEGMVSEACQPYTVPKCADLQPCLPTSFRPGRAKCQKACYGNDTSATMGKFVGDETTIWTMPGQAGMQKQLMTNGPISAQFAVFTDFEVYKSGVYQPSKFALPLGGHAVKVIGWGTDDNSHAPYWLVANSWTESWGEAGFFRILRGNDTCGFEAMPMACKAKTA